MTREEVSKKLHDMSNSIEDMIIFCPYLWSAEQEQLLRVMSELTKASLAVGC